MPQLVTKCEGSTVSCKAVFTDWKGKILRLLGRTSKILRVLDRKGKNLRVLGRTGISYRSYWFSSTEI